MRLVITAVSIVLVFFALVQSGVINALVLFVIIGAIPSTNFALPPSIMILIISLVSWLVVVQSTLSIIKKYRLSNKVQPTSYHASLANRRKLSTASKLQRV